MNAMKPRWVANSLVSIVTALALYALCVTVFGSPIGTPAAFAVGVIGAFAGNLLTKFVLWAHRPSEPTPEPGVASPPDDYVSPFGNYGEQLVSKGGRMDPEIEKRIIERGG